MVAVQVRKAGETIVSRNRPARRRGAVHHANPRGQRSVIPDDATLIGTVRALHLPLLDLMEQRMRDVASHAALPSAPKWNSTSSATTC
jgi:hippurate hydrolase